MRNNRFEANVVFGLIIRHSLHWKSREVMDSRMGDEGMCFSNIKMETSNDIDKFFR